MTHSVLIKGHAPSDSSSDGRGSGSGGTGSSANGSGGTGSSASGQNGDGTSGKYSSNLFFFLNLYIRRNSYFDLPLGI